LVPVANKPILFYGLEAIRDAGITDVGIVVGDTREEIRAAVGDGSAFGIDVTYIEQEAPLGIAHAVLVSEDYIGQEPFVLFLGDNLIKEGITNFVREFEQEKPNSQILLTSVDNPEEFGVAELDGGRVVKLVEKPKQPKSNLALVGVYMFDANVFEAAKNIKPSWRDELEITDAIQYLIDKGLDVRSHMVTGWWKDTGKLEDLLEANRLILSGIDGRIEGTVDDSSKIDGVVIVEPGSVVEKSVLRGPLIIGRNSKVSCSYVGPFTSIHGDVSIENSEVEHSIILSSCVISDIPGRIERSLVGRNVSIRRSSLMPKAYRFMVGDNSDVEVF
jgi:glucose-1-phosphate thymidylyltransferase